MPVARTIAISLALILLAPFALGQDADRESLSERWNRRLTGSLLVLVRQAPTRTPPKGYGTGRWLLDHPPYLAALDLSSGTLDIFAGPLGECAVTEQVEYQWGASSRQVYIDGGADVGRGIFICDRDRHDPRLLIHGFTGFSNETPFRVNPVSFGFDVQENVVHVAMRFDILHSPLDSARMNQPVPDWAEASLLRNSGAGREAWVDLLTVDTAGAVTFVTRLLDLDDYHYGGYRIAPSGGLVAHRGDRWSMFPGRKTHLGGITTTRQVRGHDLTETRDSRVEILDCLSGRLSVPMTDLPGGRIMTLEFSPDGRALAAVTHRSGSSHVYLCRAPGFTRFEKLAELPQTGWSRLQDCCWSPDGQWLLFSGCRSINGKICELIAVEVASGDTIRLQEYDLFGVDRDSAYHLLGVHDWID